jgi:hypothetical protein
MGRALRDIELVRKQPHAPAEKRSDDIVLANRPEATNVSERIGIERDDVLRTIESRTPLDSARGKPNPESRLNSRQRITVCSDAKRCPGLREMDDDGAPFDGRHAPDAELRIETVREVVASLPRLPGTCHLPMIASEVEAYNPPT